MADQPLDETSGNETNKIPYAALPDNTFTVVLKANGKVYALGGEIGAITPEIPDEDLDSVLRAANGAGLTLQRTIAMNVAGRDAAYALPGDQPAIEEDLTPKVPEEDTALLYIAGTDIRKGQALHLSLDGKVLPVDSKESKS